MLYEIEHGSTAFVYATSSQTEYAGKLFLILCIARAQRPRIGNASGCSVGLILSG